MMNDTGSMVVLHLGEILYGSLANLGSLSKVLGGPESYFATSLVPNGQTDVQAGGVADLRNILPPSRLEDVRENSYSLTYFLQSLVLEGLVLEVADQHLSQMVRDESSLVY